MAVAAKDDGGLGPGGAQALQHPFDDRRMLGAGRALAGTPGGGDEFPGQTLENEQGQVAMAALVVVIEDQFLLARRGILGMIPRHYDHGGRRGVAGDELIHDGLRHPLQSPRRCRVFQTGEGRRTGEVRRFLPRPPLLTELEQRIGAQGMGVMAILVSTGDWVSTLGEPGLEAVGNVRRMT